MNRPGRARQRRVLACCTADWDPDPAEDLGELPPFDMDALRTRAAAGDFRPIRWTRHLRVAVHQLLHCRGDLRSITWAFGPVFWPFPRHARPTVQPDPTGRVSSDPPRSVTVQPITDPPTGSRATASNDLMWTDVPPGIDMAQLRVRAAAADYEFLSWRVHLYVAMEITGSHLRLRHWRLVRDCWAAVVTWPAQYARHQRRAQHHAARRAAALADITQPATSGDRR
ncbi:hypothetical protein [Hamadaea tsunoensis]|uniref:hypothetical protein n=1 Tax=Hamadaea tsunoensis TaxID=53368 RepID=UPI00042377D8|nr:hypothetical protein [Hamadaea tsunoensis]